MAVQTTKTVSNNVPLRALRAVIHSSRKAQSLREELDKLGIKKEDKNNGITEIKLVSAKDKEIKSNGDGKQILELPDKQFLELIKNLNITPEKENTDEKDNYSLEDKDELIGISKYESSIFQALNNIKDFWTRAHGRKTGMFSWILSWTFNLFGFKNIKEVTSSVSSPDFLKGVAKYYKNLKSGKDKAQAHLENALGDNRSKINLANLAVKTLNIFNKIPEWFLNVFPTVFCVQNVFVPFLKQFVFKESKALKTLFIVNPWIDEFCSTIMGVFKKEIKDVKNHLKDSSNTNKEEKINFEENHSPINSIVLTNLNSDQYRLKKAVDKVNDTFERLLGRNSSLSSLLVGLTLKMLGFKSYQDFADKTIKKEDFVQKLHNCLTEFNQEIKSDEERNILGKKFYEKLEKYFKDKKEREVARIVSATISMSNNLKEGFIEKGTGTFGGIYSFQYLFMPVLSTLVGSKGFFGKLLGFFAFVNPIINDFCMDPVATFKEEVLQIKEETKSLKHLFPELPKVDVSKPVSYIFTTAKSILNAVQSFIKTRFGSKQTVQGITP